MENMNEIKFQYYPAKVKSNKPLGYVSLPYFLQSIMNPKPHLREVFKQIQQAEIEGDMERKAELKQENLFYFTPCVHVDGYRRYDNIIQFTGLMTLDFDHVANAKELKEELFTQFQSVIATFLSPSKNGVKALVKIPICESVEEFKKFYWGMEEALKGWEGFDPTGQNAVLPLFYSWDVNLLVRSPASWKEWTKTAIKETAFDTTEQLPVPEGITPTSLHQRRVLGIINSALDKITDTGHPQLRSISLIAGGYMASGYISRDDLLNHFERSIKQHPYLKKGVYGYVKTMREAVSLGSRQPLILE